MTHKPAAVLAEGWGWRHAGRSTWAVRDLSIRIDPGERVLLLGASGAGKSTLLHGLAGVLGGADEGTETGRLLVDGQPPASQRGRSSLVLQDPYSQIALTKIGDEVAFGCENLGVKRDEIWSRVEDSLDAVALLPELTRPERLERPTAHLSGGQTQRLVLAGALAMRPGLLLLDEPTANLDPAGVGEVRDAVRRVCADRDVTLIVVEHRVDVWADLVDRVIVLDADGGLLADANPDSVFATHEAELSAAGVWVPKPHSEPTQLESPSGEPVLRGERLEIGYDKALGEPIDCFVPEGASLMVTGPNGCGKTTLALTLAGLLPQISGQVVAAKDLVPPRKSADPHSWSSKHLLTRLGTVFQNPEHQFIASSVGAEIAAGPKALKLARDAIDSKVDELLERLRLKSLREANPFTLSGGEKRRLSVATVLATSPQVIFLDEPTFGQDRNTWAEMVELVANQIDAGRTVVSVTHDRDYIATAGNCDLKLGAL